MQYEQLTNATLRMYVFKFDLKSSSESIMHRQTELNMPNYTPLGTSQILIVLPGSQ